MRLIRTSAALFITTLLLSACGGGGGGGATAAAPVAGHAGGPVTAALVFRVASSSTTSAQAKRANDLPAATQSLVVQVLNPDGTPFGPQIIVNVTATNCPSSGGVLTCTVMVSVPQSAMEISVVAYSAANGTGSPLSSGFAATTVTGATSSISVPMSTATAYVATSLNGTLSVVAIDHAANTIAIAKVGGTTGDAGTIVPLANGYEKITISTATDGTPVGSVAYLHESPNGGGFFFAKGLSTNADGSTTQGDWGVATAVQPCGSITGNLGYNLITIAGPGFQAAPTTSKAYQVGTVTVTNTSLNATGTQYAYNGTNLGPDTGGGNSQTCSGGIFTSTNNGAGAFDSEGVIVSVDDAATVNPTTATHLGDMGFFAPAQPYDLNALASVSYYGAIGYSVNVPVTARRAQVATTLTTGASPGFATPAGGTSLNACGYTDFDNNVVNTSSCSTVTLQSQPFPGIVTGTVTSPGGPSSFVAAVGQVNGKYMLDVISVEASTGIAENLAFMQQ